VQQDQSRDSWQETMNRLGASGTPFLFILDFELEKPIVLPLVDVGENIRYQIGGLANYPTLSGDEKKLEFTPHPMSPADYRKAFEMAVQEIQYGNSFLLNLTFPTPVATNYTLEEIFQSARARYKLYIKDECVVFSPETFVTIRDGKIKTFPMKGTIDADIPNAQHIILADPKETAEHYTIVDLLRNDLSMVSKGVKVNRFRYLDLLHTSRGRLWQVSSEIEGTLPSDYQERLGDIFATLLPAGSISGAPKKKTVEIIQQCEQEKRGYFTGVFGIFDGTSVESAVMIRYIEMKDGKYYYRSGCGITFMSSCEAEFEEMIAKVYVPFG
jgi:para-aminobenzoate synthetase component 1